MLARDGEELLRLFGLPQDHLPVRLFNRVGRLHGVADELQPHGFLEGVVPHQPALIGARRPRGAAFGGGARSRADVVDNPLTCTGVSFSGLTRPTMGTMNCSTHILYDSRVAGFRSCRLSLSHPLR